MFLWRLRILMYSCNPKFFELLKMRPFSESNSNFVHLSNISDTLLLDQLGLASIFLSSYVVI